MFLPNVRQMYSFTAAGDPVSLYLHFTGQAAAEAMQYLRPTQSMIYTISDQTLFESLFHRLNRLHNLQQSAALQIPEEKSLLLQHMILSHHGEPEFGAAVRPMCIEAELLSYLDLIDSRMEIYTENLENTPAGTFSGKIYAIDKKIYNHG